jgi:hypothetical protein
MMGIEIREENIPPVLSKTQKNKIKKYVRQIWKDEAVFYDQIDQVIGQVHYADPNQRHNHIEHNLDANNNLVLLFKRIQIETEEERRKKLQNKLRNAIRRKKHQSAHTDPQERQYQQLCQLLPEAQQSIIPTPTQVRANPELYRQMASTLPAQNPVCQYLNSFIA